VPQSWHLQNLQQHDADEQEGACAILFSECGLAVSRYVGKAHRMNIAKTASHGAFDGV
jgi:hypothetical protein